MTNNDPDPAPAPLSPYGLAPTPGGGWVPVPDPTERTTRDLLDRLSTQREILEAQLTALREAIEARLDAADDANLLRLKAFDRLPRDVNEMIGHLKELHGERFASIALQFKERDERSAQLAKTQAEALEAALRAAKELNSAQGEANKEANAKTEVTFGQQIKAVEDKIEVINRRLDTGQGSTEGAAGTRTESRLNQSQLIAWLGAAGLVLGLILTFYSLLHKP